jgi:hypothetical protein
MNTGTNSGGFGGQGQGMVSRRLVVMRRRQLTTRRAAVRPVRHVPAQLERELQRRERECDKRHAANDGSAETAATAERLDCEYGG